MIATCGPTAARIARTTARSLAKVGWPILALTPVKPSLAQRSAVAAEPRSPSKPTAP
ncbi:MAG: hypothetical protein LW847_12710 [Burkholderiales bacterium]|nr:hypothetical protein [Burkholderiales bacterium]